MSPLRWLFLHAGSFVMIRGWLGTLAILTVLTTKAQTATIAEPYSETRACGGNLYGEGNITSPGYPNNFPSYSWCIWTITAASGSEILLEILDLELDKKSHTLAVRNDGANYVYYLLSGTDNNVTSLRLSSHVTLFFATYRNSTRRGFSVMFRSVAAPNVKNSSLSYDSNVFRSCGSNLTRQGQFTSPNYPAQYPNNADCTWNIFASPGKVLHLFCIVFDLENTYDSIYVTSQMYNKTTSVNYWLLGNSSNCSLNLGPNATVTFRSDTTVRHQGFVIGFRSVQPPPIAVNRATFTQCGGNLTGSGTVSSPNYPGLYPSNSRCIWRIRASDGQVLRIKFNAYNIEDEYDYFCVYNSKDLSQSAAINFTSSWQESMYWAPDVIAVFSSDESVELSGFQFTFYSEYNTTTSAPNVGCGGDIYMEGYVFSPNYPNQYTDSSSCSWYVYTSYESLVVIQFVDLDIVKGSDYITISTNGSRARYSGSDLPRAIRGGSTAYIRFECDFLSNRSLTRRGFKIRIYSINTTNNSANFTNTDQIDDNFTSCDGNFTGKGNLTSPGYPALYPNNAYCRYSLRAQSANDNIVLKFTIFDLEPDYDYLKIYPWFRSDNSNVYYFYSSAWLTGSSLPSTLVLPNQATIWFISDTTVRGRGFFATWTSVPENSTSPALEVSGYATAIPLTNKTSEQTTNSVTSATTTGITTLTTKQTTILAPTLTMKQLSTTVPTYFTCGGILYNGTAFASPSYQTGYQNNTFCNWTLIASPGKVVLLSIQVFTLQSGSDYLRIYNGTDISWKTHFISYTGSMLPAQLLLTESATVIFASDESLSILGFNANFTSVSPRGGSNSTLFATSTTFEVCGGSLGASGEIVSPNFPTAYPNKVSCVWTFTVPLEGAYEFEFLNFSTEQFWDVVTIRSGAIEKNRFSGSQIPAAVSVFSNGSILFASDESVQMSGFKIRYNRLTSVTTLRPAVHPTTTTSSLAGVCGLAVADMRTENARSSGGSRAPANSVPWQVKIVRASKMFSGVLLNNQWVLTAASNMKTQRATAYSLMLGKQRANARESRQRNVAARRLEIYPGYNETAGDGDLALIQLATSVRFTNNIRPICWPTATVHAGDVCFATGWGLTTGTTSFGFLKVAQVTLIDKQSCFNYINKFSKNQICAGHIGGGLDICEGDTGGPLVYFQNGRYELHGITSSHTSCSKPFYPSAFTAVAPYISWIASVVK